MTLRQFFEQHPWLNQSEVAAACEIDPGVFRGYVSGFRNPSVKTLQHIEDAIKSMLVDSQDFELTRE